MTMRISALAIATIFAAAGTPALAQEHHLWQDRGTFEPYSRTAQSITGPITMSGNPDFAEPGSTMTISFDGGRPVELKSVGATYRAWGLGGEVMTAETFAIQEDPGRLVQWNTLCSSPPRYIVFTDPYAGNGKLLSLAVFSGDEPPKDIDDASLCSTFNYYPPDS